MSVENVSAGLKPTRPEQITLEAWSQGFMVGSLIIMAGITLSNMRSGVLLHKLILIELALAIPNGFFAFFEPPTWGWFLSATVVPLLTSWTLHNVIAWIKNKPFLEPRGSAIYIGTVILVQPYWILEIYANFAYFNTDNSRLFTLTRPFEAICRSQDLGIYVWFIPESFGLDLGILECPELYQMDPDGESTNRTWILAVGANGYRYGRTTGTAYWTGEWDGNDFTATNDFPQWMDDGPDFYATVSWDNPNDKYGSHYAIGWMNNWDYAASLPYYGDFAGQDSMVRQVKLTTINGSRTLVSLPIGGYGDIFAPPISVSRRTITSNLASASLLGGLTDGAYVIRATITKDNGDTGNEVRFRIKSDQSFRTTIGYDFRNSQAFLVRDSDGSATYSMARVPKQAYDAVRTALNPSGGRTVDMFYQD
ncbi:hypothetical protein S40285_08737 [Stachybotrys chlorohalonatus IBT 40285]|uniref:Uncharacterized protein n=1 Tax=Stachybotrys chlorohalonatus (strain IBT 40285) TaxID=1283841 RepID=A0A084R047_STAC4|nr:hypothetical protein S40285_08737 [Stachybotrys chlorohalonata IBT 40285]